MPTIIHSLPTHSRKRRLDGADGHVTHRKPLYDCSEQRDALTLTVFVPGVEASGIHISSKGPDLIVEARKSHFVRVNFQPLNLEGAQRDYRLVLRLGHHLDFARLEPEFQKGVLTLRIPKRLSGLNSDPASLRRVA